MMHAVRGIYRGGVVELLESPEISDEAEVVVTFLSDASSWTDAPFVNDERPQVLDDFEPIVPTSAIRLSAIVLEDRE